MGEVKDRLKGQGTEQSGLCLLPLSVSGAVIMEVWAAGVEVCLLWSSFH